MPNEDLQIEQAIYNRVHKFEMELRHAVRDWTTNVFNSDDPEKRLREIQSSIEMYGEE